MLTPEQYAIERAICDKDEATCRALWPAWKKGGLVPREVAAHPDCKACDNAMRGRVEQFELLRDLPETIFAYVGEQNEQDRKHLITNWPGDVIGTARAVSSWRVNSHMGLRMYQFAAKIGSREYAGRGFGEGCCITLRETAASKRKNPRR